MGNWGDFTPANGGISPYLQLVFWAHLVLFRKDSFDLVSHEKMLGSVQDVQPLNTERVTMGVKKNIQPLRKYD